VIARFQALFSVSSAPGATIDLVNAPASNRPKRTAAITDGTAVAVAAVPSPERRNHEAQRQLELVPSDGRGGASAPSLDRPIRWLV
jgi:hypothetical protein